MPEGDTVWLTAHRLDQALAGREVIDFDLRTPGSATQDVRPASVLAVLARGKHLLMRFDTGWTLHSHLRMDGAWHIERATRRAPGTGERRTGGGPDFAIRAVIGNSEWRAVGHRVHELRLVRHADEQLLVGHLGPDLLGPGWDAAEAVRRLITLPDRQVGEALLDQTCLAGIGNLYKSEVLFCSRQSPWSPVAEVTDLAGIVDLAQRLLRSNRDRAEQSTTGLTRRGEEHWVYLRGGQPCRRCGTPIRRLDQGTPPRQRSTYWCPACQPGATPD